MKAKQEKALRQMRETSWLLIKELEKFLENNAVLFDGLDRNTSEGHENFIARLTLLGYTRDWKVQEKAFQDEL